MHIYFSGIGGSAIGPLAILAMQAGYQVSGSDLQKSAFTDKLVELDIDLEIGPQDGNHIKEVHKKNNIDWFVHSSAVPKTSPDFTFAMKHDIRISKRDEIINQILADNKLRLIAIAGTHGKTTTTAMLVWLFEHFNIPVSYSVGSNLPFTDSAKFNSSSQHFVYEADEFDKNFLHFKPSISAITNIDYDHKDTYPTVKDYRKAYAKFMKQSDSIVSWVDEVSHTKFKAGKSDVIMEAGTDIHPDIGLVGVHNRKNASIAIEVFRKINPEIPHSKIIATINSFPGTERRFERIKLGLYSDYAHHPSEIKATLQLAVEQISRLRKLTKNKRELVVVYQPHQNIRQVELHQNKDYSGVFDAADRVYWLPTYLSREDPQLKILSSHELLSGFETGDKFQEFAIGKALKTQINKELRNKNIVVCMSAGDLDPWLRDSFMKISWRARLQKFLPY